MLVIYDSEIHSGSIPDFLRKRFAEKPPVKGGSEKAWIKQYVDVRHQWLKTHPKKFYKKQFIERNVLKPRFKTIIGI